METLFFDTIVICAGQEPERTLFDKLQDEKIKAVYKTYEIPLSKRQKALQRVRERMQQLEKEIEDIKKKKIADAKSHVLRKQQFQKMGRKSRENFRKEN